MFSFQDGLATNLTFRLTPGAGMIFRDDEYDSMAPEVSMSRALPDLNVTPETLTDAYVDFILYCNPQFPLDVDTSQLRLRFNSAPRSDNKEFETWTLLGLIRAFNAKRIDTWGQLALELGVEPPDPAKNQSVQKVQQYTVRLKRWMRALHIDAFFEFLDGKDHVYFTQIPPVEAPYPAEGRDGVQTDEDLAIRALEPSFRPKRGRRRNSDIEQEEAAEGARRMQQGADGAYDDPASAYPQSAIPNSAHPNMHDPWANAAALSQAWPTQSAITPSTSHMRWDPGDLLGSAYDDTEPRSAVLPSGKKRRRHGPAVSSAWSASTPTGSKPRGRPPTIRHGQEGPFSSFPVHSEYDTPISAIPRSAKGAMDMSESLAANMPPPATRSMMPAQAMERPARLSLTVPQHCGGPVRLATPPRVALHSDANASETGSVSQTPEPLMLPSNNRHNASSTVSMPSESVPFSFGTLKRTLASDLLRADVIGRPNRLSGDEAKRLADSILERLKVPDIEIEGLQPCVARLTAASWLGLGDQLNIPSGPAAGTTKKIRVTRFRHDSEGYEEVVPAEEETSGQVRQLFDLRWQATQGSCQGKFEISSLTLSPTEKTTNSDIHDVILTKVLEQVRAQGLGEVGDLESRGARNAERNVVTIRKEMGTEDQSDDSIDWKTKYRMMEFGSALAKGEFDRYRELMLQKVLDIFVWPP